VCSGCRSRNRVPEPKKGFRGLLNLAVPVPAIGSGRRMQLGFEGGVVPGTKERSTTFDKVKGRFA